VDAKMKKGDLNLIYTFGSADICVSKI